MFLTRGIIEVLPSKHELHVGAPTRMELERVAVAAGVLPIHDDVDTVQIQNGVPVDVPRLGGGGLYTTMGLY